jgi:predicted RNA binding protein YcfA (HicA-like mRNA interferase family)
MSKRDKLLEKLRRLPPQADFADVRALVEAEGWTLHNTKGSHFYFKREHERPLAVVTQQGRTVKRTYVREILRRLGLEDQDD